MMRTRVKCFFGNFKYEGFLVGEDNGSYTVEDQKEGLIRLPKNQTIIKILEVGEDEV